MLICGDNVGILLHLLIHYMMHWSMGIPIWCGIDKLLVALSGPQSSSLSRIHIKAEEGFTDRVDAHQAFVEITSISYQALQVIQDHQRIHDNPVPAAAASSQLIPMPRGRYRSIVGSRRQHRRGDSTSIPSTSTVDPPLSSTSAPSDAPHSPEHDTFVTPPVVHLQFTSPTDHILVPNQPESSLPQYVPEPSIHDDEVLIEGLTTLHNDELDEDDMGYGVGQVGRWGFDPSIIPRGRRTCQTRHLTPSLPVDDVSQVTQQLEPHQEANQEPHVRLKRKRRVPICGT